MSKVQMKAPSNFLKNILCSLKDVRQRTHKTTPHSISNGQKQAPMNLKEESQVMDLNGIFMVWYGMVSSTQYVSGLDPIDCNANYILQVSG